MKKRILLAFSLFSLLILFTTKLQAQTNLILSLNDGTEKSALLSSLNKLTFVSDNLVLNYNAGNTEAYAVSNVHKIIFGTTSAVSELSANNTDLVIYPNPADQYLLLKNIPNVEVRVNVYSLDGSLVKSESINSNEQIDISNLSTGFYILKINNKALKFTKR